MIFRSQGGSCPARSGLDFQPDDVVWVIKPSTATLIGCSKPLRADDRHQYLAGCYCAADFLGEVNARLDRVHIDEDLALAETIGQAVIQPASQMAGFLPTVANEDATTLSYGHGQSRYRRATWTETCQFMQLRAGRATLTARTNDD